MYLKKIPIVFHIRPNYDYQFIMKELAEEFKKHFLCLRENTKKITFTVPIGKEVTRIDKNGQKITKNISYILQFVDSTRFMASSLTNLVNNLSKIIHRIKCKFGHDDKKCKTCGIKYKYCDCFLEYTNFKDDFIEYKCLHCNKHYQHKFDENLKEPFCDTFKFSNNDNNKFILLLRKGAYHYEYMNDCEKFNKDLLLKKEAFYCHLNMEEVIDADYCHGKRDCKDFKIKSLGEFHDFYVQSSTLLLADVFENFQNMCLKIYELDSVKFVLAPGLAW